MSDFSSELAKLSSAEDFFGHFQIEFDPKVMAVNRLHILKRFHDYLARIEGLDTLDGDAKRATYRQELVRAYGDFVTSSARAEKVFPVFRLARGAFVALSSVRPLPRI